MGKVGQAIVVHGRVQGVGFRYFACDIAKRCSVCGFVKNMQNGTVYAELYGEKKNVQECVMLMTENGSCGTVTDYSIEEIAYRADLTDFSIKRDYEP